MLRNKAALGRRHGKLAVSGFSEAKPVQVPRLATLRAVEVQVIADKSKGGVCVMDSRRKSKKGKLNTSTVK